VHRALGLTCLLALLAGPVGGADRLEVRVGPHLSSRDGTDSARELQNMMQLKINTLGEEAFGKPELQSYIESHVAQRWETDVPPVLAVLEAAWSQSAEVLVIIAGQYQQDQDTFISTFFVGPTTADFTVRSATVNILATPAFRTQNDMATLVLHYAMVRDARNENKDREIVVPIASRALEIVAEVKPLLTDNASKVIVAAIEADLNKIVDQLRIEP
jgi:hypothetical protein